MPFQPSPGQVQLIDEVAYRIAEHPNAPGMPYGQEGRQAIVYKLVSEDNEQRALKVFKPRFRTPSLVSQADQIAPFASLLGLEVCKRKVLTPSRHDILLRDNPDLIFSVVMPWVEGPTWQETLINKQAFPPQESLKLALSTASVILSMEEHGIAHCDLSAANIILSPDLSNLQISLVDIEGMFSPGLLAPEALSSGSPGYAHKSSYQGLWNAHADRFAGAVLLAEMLGWCSAAVRQESLGEYYFQHDEMQSDCPRFQLLVSELKRNWGDEVVNLFIQAWKSDTLTDCPTLGEWLITLPKKILEKHSIQLTIGSIENGQEFSHTILALLEVANDLKNEQNYQGAEANLQMALSFCSDTDGLFQGIQLLIDELKLEKPKRIKKKDIEEEIEKETIVEYQQEFIEEGSKNGEHDDSGDNIPSIQSKRTTQLSKEDKIYITVTLLLVLAVFVFLFYGLARSL